MKNKETPKQDSCFASSSIDLLDCPLCGGTDLYFFAAFEEINKQTVRWHVECENCGKEFKQVFSFSKLQTQDGIEAI